MANKTQFQVEVHVMDTNSSVGTIIKACNYYFTCNKVMWVIVPSQRYDYVSIGCYALNLTKLLQK